MKKLKLTALDLGAKEILSRSQLKNIFGGSGSEPGSTDPGTGSGESCSGFSSCCVECENGHGKTKDCGFGVTCFTDGTKIKCGDTGTWTEMC